MDDYNEQKIKEAARIIREARQKRINDEKRRQEQEDEEFRQLLAKANIKGDDVRFQDLIEASHIAIIHDIKKNTEKHYCNDKQLWSRPTPQPKRWLVNNNTTFLSSSGRDGSLILPTRKDIARDERDRCLGISNAYGTGKTQFALATVEATLQKESTLRVLYASFSNGWHDPDITKVIQTGDPQVHFSLWLHAAYHSTQTIKRDDDQWEVICSPEMFKDICKFFLQHPEEKLPEFKCDPSMIVVFDEVQMFSYEKFQQFVDQVITLDTRISLLVGAFSPEFTVGSANRVCNIEFGPLTEKQVELLFQDSNVNAVYENIQVPRLLGGCIRPFTNFNAKFEKLTESNDPIAVLYQAYYKIYRSTNVPAILFRAAISDRPCSTDVLRAAFESSSASLGAVMVHQHATDRCLVKVSPFQIMTNVDFGVTEDPVTHDYIKSSIRDFILPNWAKFEVLAGVAPALRISALTHVHEMGWDENLSPLQEIFAGAAVCNELAVKILQKPLQLNLKIRRVNAGTSAKQIDASAAMYADNLLQGHVTLITCSGDHEAPLDCFLIVPYYDQKNYLIMGIDSKFTHNPDTTKKLQWKKEVLKKVNNMKKLKWPNNWEPLVVLITSRQIPEFCELSEQSNNKVAKKNPKNNKRLNETKNIPLIISNNLKALFGSCLVPARFDQPPKQEQ
jgi:hypothetical protein